nr:Chain E, PEPTIDE B1 [synthetic construct]3GGW_F Chain F, PEPTIDE B1 [synthetic construct]
YLEDWIKYNNQK